MPMWQQPLMTTLQQACSQWLLILNTLGFSQCNSATKLLVFGFPRHVNAELVSRSTTLNDVIQLEAHPHLVLYIVTATPQAKCLVTCLSQSCHGMLLLQSVTVCQVS